MASSDLASFIADVEQLVEELTAIGVRLRALSSQDDRLRAASRVPGGGACGKQIPHADRHEPGDEHIRRAPATPGVVEVTRAGRPWTRAAMGRTARCR